MVAQAKGQDDAQDQGQETRQDRAHIEDRVGEDRVAVPLIGVLSAVVFELVSLSTQIGLPHLQVPLQGDDLAAGFGVRLNQLTAGLGDLGLRTVYFLLLVIVTAGEGRQQDSRASANEKSGLFIAAGSPSFE